MNAGLPDDLGPYDSRLDDLFRALAAAATPDELAGEAAAAAMFRASRAGSGPAASTGPAGPGIRVAPARPAAPGGRWARTGRLLGAAAVGLAAAGLAGAYAAVLPTPVQHAAYRVLGFAGIPDAPHPGHQGQPAPLASRTGRASAPGASGHASSPASVAPGSSPAPSPAGAPGRSQAAGPPPVLPLQLSATVAVRRITAGGSDSIAGLLTDRSGQAVAGQQLTLIERAAGETAWRPAGKASTSTSGTAVLPVPDLTADAAFRITGPDGALSQPVRVVVVLPVTLAAASGPRPRTGTLTASSPLASPGDLVTLQVRAAGNWVNVSTQPLGEAGQAAFTVRIRRLPRRYRAVLDPTAAHGLSASSPVTAG